MKIWIQLLFFYFLFLIVYREWGNVRLRETVGAVSAQGFQAQCVRGGYRSFEPTLSKKTRKKETLEKAIQRGIPLHGWLGEQCPESKAGAAQIWPTPGLSHKQAIAREVSQERTGCSWLTSGAPMACLWLRSGEQERNALVPSFHGVCGVCPMRVSATLLLSGYHLDNWMMFDFFSHCHICIQSSKHVVKNIINWLSTHLHVD